MLNIQVSATRVLCVNRSRGMGNCLMDPSYVLLLMDFWKRINKWCWLRKTLQFLQRPTKEPQTNILRFFFFNNWMYFSIFVQWTVSEGKCHRQKLESDRNVTLSNCIQYRWLKQSSIHSLTPSRLRAGNTPTGFHRASSSSSSWRLQPCVSSLLHLGIQ